MLERPNLTEEQRKKFEDEFSKIIKQAPEDVQYLWNSNPTIYWPTNNDYVISNNVHLKLKGKQADLFVGLSNKVLSRSL